MQNPKKTIIILLYTLHLLTPIPQNCETGCLMCSSDNLASLCLVCDITKFFTKSGYVCKSTPTPNCMLTRDGLTCESCLKDYYLDKTTNNCVKVEKLLENCRINETATICKECEIRFFYDVKSGGCVAISKDIPNCLVYESGATCKVCDNSTLSQDKASCVKIINSDNCAYFSGDLSCSACKSGYKYFLNKYVIDMQNDSVFLDRFYKNTVYNSLDYNLIFQTKTNVCVKGISNCLEYEKLMYNECKVCEVGYFLGTNKICYKNPIQTLSNCAVYESSTSCSVCKQDYYLLESKCKQHSTIAFCNSYSLTTPDVCSECQENYYFNLSENKCVKRTISIKKCAKYTYNLEKCEECQESYIVSKDFNSCIPQISKCSDYLFIPNADGTFSLLCKTCIPGFYILTKIISSRINTTCELPTVLIEGCYSYQSEDQCVECRPGYYLANFKCHLHNQLILDELSCKDLSVFTLNDCSGCPEHYYLYKLYNYCKTLSETELVENCNEYDVSSKCYKCDINYYLDSTNNVCVLSNIIDCAEFDRTTNKCLICDIKKNLMPSNNNVNNKCIAIPEYMKTNCTDLSVDIVGAIGCNECDADYYPYDLGNSYWSFCISQTELTDFREQFSENNAIILNNCLSFDFQTKKCLYCDPESTKNYVSSESGICLESCSADEIAYTFLLDGIYPKSYLKCQGKTNIQNFTNIDNCARLDFDMTERPTTGNTADKITKSCIECKPGYIGIIDDPLNFTYSHFESYPAKHLPTSSITKASYFSITHKVPLFTRCQLFNSSTSISGIPYNKNQANAYEKALSNLNASDASAMANYPNYFNYCQNITAQTRTDGTISYGCSRCKFGTSGIVVKSHNAGTSADFIHNCQVMDGCDANKFYTGIGNYSSLIKLNYFISCSVCSNNNEVVTFPYGVVRWIIPAVIGADTKVTVTTNDATNVDAADLTKILMPMNSCEMKGLVEQNSNSFPNSCAVQTILPELKLFVYTIELETTPNPICVACLPKYRPSLSNVIAKGYDFKYIIACESISNCKTSLEYNKCQECEDNFVLQYDSTAENSWKTKAEFCVSNTLVGCLVGETDGICYRCKDGYILNTMGICDLVMQDERCKEKGPIISYDNAFDYLNDFPIRLGCTKCKEGLLPVRLNFNPKYCILNTAIKGTTIGDTHSITNCLKYKFNTTGLICSNCLNGYYLTIDGKKCITERTSNCLSYQEQGSDYTCMGCKNKYYLDGGKCYKGEIQGCLEYDNKENCVSCEGELIATRINNNQFTICFDVSKSINNCLSNDLIESFKGILKCTKCSNKSFPIYFDLAIKTCGKFFTIVNCISYELSESFGSSTFFCNECEPEYYTIKQFPSKCTVRTKFPIDNCKEYSKYSDKCENCIEGFFLQDNLCILNPSGIQGCRIYKTREECLECDSNNYLFENNCKELSDEDLIGNCYTYNIDKTCQKCAKKFLINGNGCLENIIQNCEIYDFDKVCEKCITEYAFFGEKCEKVNVANCQKYKDPNTCEICNQNFYIAEGTGRCFEVIQIKNCSEYSDKDKCSLCEPGYIITEDQKSCLSLSESQKIYFNEHCSTYEQINRCVICNEGFFFNLETNRCVACSSPNCAYCNFYDDSLCVMCKTGFYQDKEGKCVANVEIVSEGDTVDKGISDFYLELGSGVLEVFLLGIFVL